MAEKDHYLPINSEQFNIDEVIEIYFRHGFTQLEILAFLSMYNQVNISLRTLQRILHDKKLRRQGDGRNLIDVINAVDEELSTDHGQHLGYRAMHQRLVVGRNITTNRETVRSILLSLDPEGVNMRKQRRLRRREYRVKGPNYLWHLDGWDKLKPFGLCVHGCIDGFSRRILWLRVAATNNDPYVICSYFATYCKGVGGIPHMIRADRGTENVNVEIMQTVLGTLNGHGGQVMFLYGKSTQNQRIEAWWSKFKQMGMQTWIDHLKSLSDAGVFDTSTEMDIQCIRFCYMNLLSCELDSIRQMWNVHYIRKSRECSSPSGKPDIMYYMPESYNCSDYIKPYMTDDMEYVEDILCDMIPDCDIIYHELFSILVAEGQKNMPRCLDEAAHLLVYILDAARLEFERQ